MKNLKLFLKGFIIGIGKIIPGVSGSMLAIGMGLYDKGIDAISNFFIDIKKNGRFLLTVGSGILLAIITCSKIIDYSLTTFYLPTMLLFIGLMAGGIPSIYKKIKKDVFNINYILCFIISFLIVIFISTLNTTNFNLEIQNFFFLIVVGFIDAFTMVLPGISGTAILMILGCYETIIKTFASLTDLSILSTNLPIILPFGIGLIIGIIIFVKMMEYMLKKQNTRTYFIVLGLAISSLIQLFLQTLKSNYSISDIIIGLILLVFGFQIAKVLEE